MGRESGVPDDAVEQAMLEAKEEPAYQSWAPEVIADDSGKWAGNGLRFATKEEAEANVQNLFMRWTLVQEIRVVQSMAPVNYRWDPSKGLVPIK